MPRAILAMRTYPATILLAVLFFIATLLITAGSLGKVRNGGDGGDGGSGMGGTGKSGEFGGSGFGGTGGPSPFFTSFDTSTPDAASQDAQADTTPAPAIAVQDVPPVQQEAPNSALQNEIIETIESNPMRAQTDIEIAQGSLETQAPLVVEEEPAPVQLVALPEVEVEVKPEAEQPQLALTPVEAVREEPADIVEEAPQQLAETMAVKLETETEEEEASRARGDLPDRIQRPEIPPFQRIRPVQRPALLPPRIQPMHI